MALGEVARKIWVWLAQLKFRTEAARLWHEHVLEPTPDMTITESYPDMADFHVIRYPSGYVTSRRIAELLLLYFITQGINRCEAVRRVKKALGDAPMLGDEGVCGFYSDDKDRVAWYSKDFTSMGVIEWRLPVMFPDPNYLKTELQSREFRAGNHPES